MTIHIVKVTEETKGNEKKKTRKVGGWKKRRKKERVEDNLRFERSDKEKNATEIGKYDKEEKITFTINSRTKWF